jgi:hypothetical protein
VPGTEVFRTRRVSSEGDGPMIRPPLTKADGRMTKAGFYVRRFFVSSNVTWRFWR